MATSTGTLQTGTRQGKPMLQAMKGEKISSMEHGADSITVLRLCGSEAVGRQCFYELLAEVLRSIAAAEREGAAAA